ncbi:hypothetical protein GCM10011391_31030 [Pullulanibacillus camelliae]|uniref:Copper resistance protein CopD n=1 Tax=Pullulanibacillus camelliae TaxID=1707096 RepID=A0A8J3DYL4_9BACL|nr:hypothetical protein [Pullulanibacillus camelliae]GGE50053.1 hypothetical protein GCM10011391_31030 [Pullulanibacillus camelliae]
MFVVWITEFLLYICLCLLTGTLIFYSLPEHRRPNIFVSKRLLLWTTVGAGALSFAPILSTMITMSNGIGFWTSFKNVLFVFEAGQAWIFTLAMALLLFGLIYFNRLQNDTFLARIGLILCVLLIGGYARAGHAASLYPLAGFTSHFFHLLAVTIWGGCLFVAAWLSKDEQNWGSFLRWYTPLALISVLIVLVAGFFTMDIDIAAPLSHSLSSTLYQYKQGFFSNYGQALLIKHLLVIPLLLYGLFNGFFRKAIKRYHSIKWARAESFVILLIFAVTAFMGQQPPPHQPDQYLNLYGPSPLFLAIYQKNIPSDFVVHFSFNVFSFIFIDFSLLFLLMIILSFIKKFPNIISLLMAVGFLASTYFSIMATIA